MPELDDLQHLAVALAIGVLIGFQREWRDAEEKREHSFAGARTFALVGFAGGLAGFLGVAIAAVGLAAVAALTALSYWAFAREEPGVGGTTEVAVIATYLLGVTATRGEPLLAAAGGVAVAILLALKPRVEKWAASITAEEMGAALRFLAISVIILPILPDQGYGPYEALNPQTVWRYVVLISGLSFLGYWLTKLYGAHGVLLTGLVGGLASSTATTLSLSRMTKAGTTAPRPAAAGIVAANVVMFLRVGVLLLAVSRETLLAVWPALAAGVVAGGAAAWFFWRGEREKGAPIDLGNPLELRPAFIFAALIGVIAVAARWASETFGDSGLYALAALTGLADVDALTLTAGEQAARGGVAAEVAAVAVIIAVASNTVVKTAMTGFIAGRGAGLRVAGGSGVMLAGAAAGLAAGAIV